MPDAYERLGQDLFEGPEKGESTARRDGPAVIGKYIVSREIGRGGSAVVYEAHDPGLNRSVAIKIVREADESLVARFSREAVIAARLHHPGIVIVHDHGMHSGMPYIVMECVEGRPLSEWLRARPLPELLRILEEAARALHHAHSQGVVHRDVKPQNILVGPDGIVKVVDFGLARGIADERLPLTRVGSILGTPEYMAPEQVDGRIGAIDARTDVYALGVIAYEAATGCRPHRGESMAEVLHQVQNGIPPRPESLNRSLARDLGVIIEKAMEKDPRRRYGSALELAEDLRLFLAGAPIRARRPGWIERLGRSVRRRPYLWAAAVLLLASAGAVGAAILRLGRANRVLADRVAEAPREANHWDALTRHASILHLEGRHRAERGEDPLESYRMAEESATLVLQMNPAHTRAWCERADIRLSRARHRSRIGQDPEEDLRTAEADAAQTVLLDVKVGTAWRIRGDIHYFRSTRVPDPFPSLHSAEAAYTSAIEADPRYHRAWMARAKIHALRGRLRKAKGEDPLPDYRRAESDVGEALRLNPSASFGWKWRGEVRRTMAKELGSGEEARRLNELAGEDLARGRSTAKSSRVPNGSEIGE